MKNLNFVDPEVDEQVVSKQELLSKLEEYFTPESIEWLDSMTNDISLTFDEAIAFKSRLVRLRYVNLLHDYPESPDRPKESQWGICKLLLLFDERFFTNIPLYYTESFPDFFNIERPIFDLFKRLFRTDLLNVERMKSIPLLFTKIGDKEVFRPELGDIIDRIRSHCKQNEEFAKAYQNKLVEIRNANGSLQERLALYVDADERLVYEMEQPVFEMWREYSSNPLLGNTLLELFFIALLQTPDGIQIPYWNEENYLCRLLLDLCLYDFGKTVENIFNRLFRDHTTSDIFHIICNHLKWRKNNMPQYQEDNADPSFSIENLQMREISRKEYTQFLEAQLSELFVCDIPRKYINLLYDYFFKNHDSKDSGYYDYVQNNAPSVLCNYLRRKLESAIDENNYGQIRDISRLFEKGKEDLFEKSGYDENNMNALKSFQSRISSTMKILEINDYMEKLKGMLKASGNDSFFSDASLFENKEKNNPVLSLEDFVLKYIPPEIFDKIVSFLPFQKQNEDVRQSMTKDYSGLSRQDILMERLLIYFFVSISMKNTNETLYKLVAYSTENFEQLLLYVLEQLCRMHEAEPELISLVFYIFNKLYSYIYRQSGDPIADYDINRFFDSVYDDALAVVNKYPQIQRPILDYCYKILEELWDTPNYTHNFSYPIETRISAYIIESYKGPWYGLKPLLITLRKTRREWVNTSLDANSYCLPNGNGNLVWEIEYYLGRPRSIKSLRQDMADGFSDWLKPLPESKRGDLEKRLAEFTEIEKDREGFDITYTEPDPVWRYAYVRAIADLGVDVDGKGHYIHSVMDKVAKEDPSEMVRNAAEKASAKLKNLRNGWDGDEHYKKITLAFWWIKQASRLALNLPIDGKNALLKRKMEEKNDQRSMIYNIVSEEWRRRESDKRKNKSVT